MSISAAPIPSSETYIFNPPNWIRNPHLQSILPTLKPWRLPVLWRSRHVRRDSKSIVFESDGGVCLQAHCSLQGRDLPWMIIVHGWLGSAESNYVLSLAAQLYQAGYNVCRLNLRDHGDTEHLNQGLFHSCLLNEVVDVVRVIQQHYSIKDLSLSGFSLGGNFVLRVAAQAKIARIALRTVIAICPGLNPQTSDTALASGLPIYREYFLNKWKGVLKRKQKLFPELYDFTEMMAGNSITELTDILVRNYAGFRGVRDYYDGYSLLGETLAPLEIKSHILLAKDDPIVPVVDAGLLAKNPYLNITLSDYGGHCGFMSSIVGKRWADEWVLSRLNIE